jgi:hypothetical protein
VEKEEVKMLRGLVAKFTDASNNNSPAMYTPAKSNNNFNRNPEKVASK